MYLMRIGFQDFNNTETETIGYSGFSFGIPTTSLNINATLPNGKVGVADGADLSTFTYQMNKIIGQVNNTLDALSIIVENSDAFDAGEQSSLTSSVSTIKSNFNSSMEELDASMATRMSNEISAREELDSTNQSNLGA